MVRIVYKINDKIHQVNLSLAGLDCFPGAEIDLGTIAPNRPVFFEFASHTSIQRAANNHSNHHVDEQTERGQTLGVRMRERIFQDRQRQGRPRESLAYRYVTTLEHDSGHPIKKRQRGPQPMFYTNNTTMLIRPVMQHQPNRMLINYATHNASLKTITQHVIIDGGAPFLNDMGVMEQHVAARFKFSNPFALAQGLEGRLCLALFLNIDPAKDDCQLQGILTNKGYGQWTWYYTEGEGITPLNVLQQVFKHDGNNFLATYSGYGAQKQTRDEIVTAANDSQARLLAACSVTNTKHQKRKHPDDDETSNNTNKKARTDTPAHERPSLGK